MRCWVPWKQCSALEQTAQPHPCTGDAWLICLVRIPLPVCHLLLTYLNHYLQHKQPTSTKCTCQKVRQWLGRSHDSGLHSILLTGQLSGATLFYLPCSCEPKTKMKALCFWLQYFCNILVLTFTQSVFTSNTKQPLDWRQCSASWGSTRSEEQLKLHAAFLRWVFSRSWKDARLFCSEFPVNTFIFFHLQQKYFREKITAVPVFWIRVQITLFKRRQSL